MVSLIANVSRTVLIVVNVTLVPVDAMQYYYFFTD